MRLIPGGSIRPPTSGRLSCRSLGSSPGAGSELCGRARDHSGVQVFAGIRDDCIEAGQANDDLLRARGQAGRDLVDEGRDRDGEPARSQNRDGQENERSEDEQLRPAVGGGPWVVCGGACPQHFSHNPAVQPV
jgi:hypothetical protein